jgi:hypothetical protein
LQDDLDLDDHVPDDGVVVRASLFPRAKMNEYVNRMLARAQAESAELSSATVIGAARGARGWAGSGSGSGSGRGASAVGRAGGGGRRRPSRGSTTGMPSP